MAIYRVPVELKNSGMPSSAYNIWHVRFAAAGDDPSTAIAALATWYGSLKGHLAAGTTVVFPDSVVEVTEQTEKAVGNVPATIAATGTGVSPQGLAVTVSWKTELRARRGRGRTFFGPLAPSAIASSGGLNATFLTAIQTATTALVGDSQGNVNGWAIGVWGQQSAGLVEPKVLRDITGYSIGARFAHLRSRRD